MSAPSTTPLCHTPTNECCKRVLKRLARDLFLKSSHEPHQGPQAHPAQPRPVLAGLDILADDDLSDAETTEEGCDEEVVFKRPPARLPLNTPNATPVQDTTRAETEPAILLSPSARPKPLLLARPGAPRAIRSDKRRLRAVPYTPLHLPAAAKKLKRCVAFPDQQDIEFSVHSDTKQTRARAKTRTADPCVVLSILALDPGSHCLIDVATEVVKTYRKRTPLTQQFQFTVMYPDGSQKEHTMMGREFRSTFAIAPELVITDMKMAPRPSPRQPYMKLRSRQL